MADMESDSQQEIELVADGHGFAVIGSEPAIKRFQQQTGLEGTALELRKLTPLLSKTANVLQATSTVANTVMECSGRWIKLTDESAQILRQAEVVDSMMRGSLGLPGIRRLQNMKGGQFSTHLEYIVGSGANPLLNPAALGGVAGLMTQMAMQQAMSEITDYLKKIDAKVDDVLRAQKDAALKDMIGVEMILDEAITVRDEVGRVSQVTWSKIQNSALAIAATQAYALRQIEALTEKAERNLASGDLAKETTAIERSTIEWLGVLARCFQLQDAFAVLELDRVFDSSPDELERHRQAIEVARAKRQEKIAKVTGGLLGRMVDTINKANGRVLLNPIDSKNAVKVSNKAASEIVEFQRIIDVDSDGGSAAARTWIEAAKEARDKASDLGSATYDRARAVASVAFDLGSERAAGAARFASGFRNEIENRFRKRQDGEPDPCDDEAECPE